MRVSAPHLDQRILVFPPKKVPEMSEKNASELLLGKTLQRLELLNRSDQNEVPQKGKKGNF